MPDLTFELHLVVEEEVAAIVFISSHTPLSKGLIKSWLQKGGVWLERKGNISRLRRVKRGLIPGDKLHLYYNPMVLSLEPQVPTLVADESDYSVWDKPVGMLSQGSKWGDHTTIVRWVEQYLVPQRPAFAIHRLDKDTRGLILVAHSKRAVQLMTSLFSNRQVEKNYCAVVEGNFSDTLPLLIDSPLDGKQAMSRIISSYWDSNLGQSILWLAIETGRKHQIRRHLADLGYPVVGDRRYGNGEDRELNAEVIHGHQLTAAQIKFISPLDHKPRSYGLEDTPCSDFVNESLY